MTRYRRNSKNGFTFVELMIVIAVISILVLISAPSLKELNKKMALHTSATELVQNLRRVQEMAMSAQEFNGSIPSGGYGIWLEADSFPKTSYSLFADSNDNKKYDDTELIESVVLEEGIEIADVTSSPSGSLMHVIFKAPDPEVIFTKADGAEFSTWMILILLSYGGETIFIEVNRAGLIYTSPAGGVS